MCEVIKMQEFTYTIKDEIGIHARPAGSIAKIAKEANSEITVHCKGKNADPKKIFSLLALSAKKGDEIRVTIQGPDEEEVGLKLKEYLTQNL